MLKGIQFINIEVFGPLVDRTAYGYSCIFRNRSWLRLKLYIIFNNTTYSAFVWNSFVAKSCFGAVYNIELAGGGGGGGGGGTRFA